MCLLSGSRCVEALYREHLCSGRSPGKKDMARWQEWEMLVREFVPATPVPKTAAVAGAYISGCHPLQLHLHSSISVKQAGRQAFTFMLNSHPISLCLRYSIPSLRTPAALTALKQEKAFLRPRRNYPRIMSTDSNSKPKSTAGQKGADYHKVRAAETQLSLSPSSLQLTD